jgi:phosphate transport system ATP-binding protein
MADGILVRQLHAWFGQVHVLHGIDLAIAPLAVTAIIGPSGCGKSTFIRCLNRMHEVVPGGRASGQVLLNGEDLYDPTVDPVQIRRGIGMVFQKPNPFPTMSVFENVAAGLRLGGVRNRGILQGTVEQALRQAALWDEPVGGTTAAVVHRPCPGGETRGPADGRALLRFGPHRDGQDRGIDPGTEAGFDNRHRHS